ncbi:haloacid dehalogenase [Mycobacterium gastri 'Wayne']|nr:haloacid dehalogenase [Mycobacterium gastri 'Wayne']
MVKHQATDVGSAESFLGTRYHGLRVRLHDEPMVKAIIFDVQGTATDFHSTVCDEAQRISAGRHPGVDWPEVVTRWRAAYFTTLKAAPSEHGKWISVHSVYRRSLDTVLDESGITDFSAAERDELTLAWQRLRPWPDTVAGLTRLKRDYTLATLSNADVSAVINISKRAGLPWDAIFAAEMVGAFKPDPAVYHMAATYLGLEPAEIMMVASHKYDIRAAAELGFRTAFVARPLEFGPGGDADVAYEDGFDINAADFLDLADQLGC